MDFFDAYGLSGKDLAEIDFLLAQTDTPATGDHDGFIVEGIVDVRQSGVHALGRLVDLGRTFHVQGFVRTLVVEDLDELVEPSLLLQKIGSRRLGIGIERIKPGHPQQNGRHERIHLTLKKEATKPAAGNFLQQQARFDKFIEVFNNERPHEALDMKCPAEVYQPSPRPYTGLPDIDYPLHDKTIVVTRCGRICLGKKKINFSQVFAGQAVGIKEVHDDIWLVSFMDYDLGYFDLETRVLEPLENPFGPKVLPMS